MPILYKEIHSGMEIMCYLIPQFLFDKFTPVSFKRDLNDECVKVDKFSIASRFEFNFTPTESGIPQVITLQPSVIPFLHQYIQLPLANLVP